MADKILLKRSSTADAVPSAEALELGELAINVADGRLYFKKADGTVVRVAMESEVGGSVVAIQKSQLFTANGTWARPAGMVGDQVEITGIGGGASGIYTSSTGRRHGGDGGQFVIDHAVNIGAAATVAVTVGAGGAGVSGAAGNPGGVTSFGAFLSLSGGAALTNTITRPAPLGAPGMSDEAATTRNGGDTPLGYGGTQLDSGSSTNRCGVGGGGLILDASGVRGGQNTSYSTAAVGYGAGGSGSSNTGAGAPITFGAPGALLVKWWEVVEL